MTPTEETHFITDEEKTLTPAPEDGRLERAVPYG
jgi:hypothetical protein